MLTVISEIAGGILLAWAAITVAPIVFGCTLGAFAHVIVALTKPRRGIFTPPAGSRRRQRAIASLLQLGAFAVLCLIGAVHRHLS